MEQHKEFNTRGEVRRLSLMAGVCTLTLFLASEAHTAKLQSTPATSSPIIFTTLDSFSCADGYEPVAPLIEGSNGNLYGSTSRGRTNGCAGEDGSGTFFEITPSGTLTTLLSFSAADDANPLGNLVQGTGGNLYGTTYGGGPFGGGKVFKITANGKLILLHVFNGADGANPQAGLIRDSDGNFYGTTLNGGAYESGTVFRITPKGKLTTLHSFCSQSDCPDGEEPYAGLIQGTDGNFYGTTYDRGAKCKPFGCGTIFKITPSGALTAVHSFDGADGAAACAGLVEGEDGNFFGTTEQGGANSLGAAFKITPSGELTTLYNFCSLPECADGASPHGALILGSDGNFYGTTSAGGAGFGTLFRLTPDGELTTLHSFYGADGATPMAGLVQHTNGIFYGTTLGGGTHFAGSVFSLSVGLPPFVRADRGAGKPGATVKLLGIDLAEASQVKFNGVATAFRVASKTFIEAKVPSGATTGKIQVVTPNATLSSNVPFIVLK